MLYADLKRTALAALLVIFTAPALALNGESAPMSTPHEDEGLLPLEDLRTFTRVYDHIRNAYVEELSDSTLLEYAIKGMIAELDPHSTYLDEKSFEDLQESTSGEFGGIGIEVGMEDGFVKVISPIDDTPADRAGIEAGDLIIRLDDKPVKGMSLAEAVEMMRGPKDSELTLQIVRDGVDQPFEITLIRDVIRVRSVRVRTLDNNYGYVRIAQFQIGTSGDMVREIETLKADNPNLRGLILDLRNNPGGVLQSSVEVADAFLDEGLVVYTEGRLENSDMRYHANPGEIAEDLPIVVLINEGSASAAEIVAGALQDHGRAVIIGTRSFGKGSVQTIVPISDTRAIKLTTARYYTPNGRSIQAQGIVPDVNVERAKVTALAGNARPTEADLTGHLRSGDGDESTRQRREEERSSTEKLVAEDNQLHEALNLLKGLHIFKQRQEANLARRLPPMSDYETPDEPDEE